MVDDEVLAYYFELNKRIAKVRGRLKKMRVDFYQQTMSSYCTSDGQAMYTKGFPVEKKVITLLDAEAMASNQLEIMKFKRRHFVKYLKQLKSSERYYLIRKYKWQEGGLNERIECECYEEIQEIEEAAGYRFRGYEYEGNLYIDEIEDISEASKQTFDDAFLKICQKLGV